MKLRSFFASTFVTLVMLFCSASVSAQTMFDIVGPAGSENFGGAIYVLPNGNIVIADSSYDDPGGAQDVGAVYLFDGKTGAQISVMTGVSEFDEVGGDDVIVLSNGNFVVRGYSFDDAGNSNVGFVTLCSGTTGCPATVSFMNSLVGSSSDDEIGSDVRALPNGNYVVLSQNWDNGGVSDVGAVVMCSGTTGCTGNITAGNALVGSSASDRVGRDLYILADSDFVTGTRFWDAKGAADAGAVTFCSGTTGCPVGPVSAANSLVGSAASDQVGNQGVAALPNGNYVVGSNVWNGAAADTGAATFCNGASGCVGEISAANSLVGSNTSDQVTANNAITVLANGHYVVGSRFWDSPDDLDAGALTWCSGTTGCVGPVTTSNSLYGTSFGDNVGAAMPLANGNYVAMSNSWNSATASNAGAATFCLGNGTCTGPVTATNSLVGSSTSDNIGNKVVALSNGNYLVTSVNWDGPGAVNAGSVTFCSGATGCVGEVSAVNSLVGSSPSDIVGDRAVELGNGNVVVYSTAVDIGGVDSAGAVTVCDGLTGCPIGPVTAANSLVGSTASDRVGGSGIIVLSNGSFVVLSRDWDNGGITNAGAATHCNGVVGCPGPVTASNSLVGTTAGDGVGGGGIAIGSAFVIGSGGWDNGATTDAGAITYCPASGCTGPVSVSNSIVGGSIDDRLGDDVILPTASGDAIFIARDWDVPSPARTLGAGQNVGLVTYLDTSRGFTGTVPLEFSVTGTADNGGGSFRFEYDPVNTQVVVGRPNDNTVTLLKPFACQNFEVSGDFDCDGKTDLSVFRPSTGEWWIGRTTEGFTGLQWGTSGDVPLSGDYDGDGRTDIGVFRPTATPGVADFYILPSTGSPVVAVEWGLPGDIPVRLDYDDDGRDDIAVFRPSNGSWFLLQSSNGAFQGRQFGLDGDIPLVMDFNGDGLDDLATFRSSEGTWYIARQRDNPAQNFDAIQFGLDGDVPVPADYDGDAKDDIAVFRPSEGRWYVFNSSDGSVDYVQWGLSGDVPVPGDYDGDGKADIAVFRDGIWWIRQSTGGTFVTAFGVAGDIPIPS